MPLNYAVLSDGNCIIITDTTSATNIETIPKEKVVLQIVLAGEGQNKSGVDELWIQHDGQYSTEIPYTEVDVASAGVAPVSVEAFRVAVLALLNANTFYELSAGGHIRGLISQTGSGAGDHPTLIIQRNTSGLTLTPTRGSAGVYTLTPSVPFVENNTWYNISSRFTPATGVVTGEMINIYFDSGNLKIETADLGFPQLDGVLNKTPFIIIID